jgi:tetratricopeptide (TPR) repeat protein
MVTGCSRVNVNASTNNKLELAAKYLTENKFEEAILAYKDVIQIDNSTVKAYQGLGKAYALQGDFEESQKVYTQGREVLKNKALLQLLLSQAGMYIDKGDLNQAEQIYKEIIVQNPDSIEAYQGLAMVYKQKGSIQQARAILEEAVKTNTGSSRVYVAMADYYLQINQRDRAAELIIQSLSLDINQTEAYITLKKIYDGNWTTLVHKADFVKDQDVSLMLKFYACYESGKYQEALDLYNGQIEKQCPDNQKATALACIAALQSGDKQKASGIVKEMSRVQQNDWVMADIARYYLLAGEKDKAAQWAMKSFEANGQNIEAVKILCEIYSKDNNPLSKIYVAKLLVYNWEPISVMKKELLAHSLELPFNTMINANQKRTGEIITLLEAIDLVKDLPEFKGISIHYGSASDGDEKGNYEGFYIVEVYPYEGSSNLLGRFMVDYTTGEITRIN